MIADFDSIKETQYHCNPDKIPASLKCRRKTAEELKKVMGTPAYRAPEVSF